MFDRSRINCATVKVLECNTHIENIINDTKKLGSESNVCNSLYIIPDPSHMIKLIRNIFGRNIIIDSNNEKIDFNYVVKLNELQQTERMHLANNLCIRHVNFFNKNESEVSNIVNDLLLKLYFIVKIN